MIREDIYSAVFSLVSSIPGFVLKSRKVKHWSEVEPVDQPSLFMLQRKENASTTTNMPTKWTLKIEIIMYAHTNGDPLIIPSSVLNPLIDQIVSKFEPNDALGEQTLGGLVTRCRVDGDIETDEGALGDQGVVIIPITIYLSN